MEHLQQREEHWVIAGLIGKAAHIRTVPAPGWVKTTMDAAAAGITEGTLFRCITRRGTVWGEGITESHTAGGELEQIQFLLGHVSVETTERYLGCKQRLRGAVNDKIGLQS
jgi:hypothetical protein